MKNIEQYLCQLSPCAFNRKDTDNSTESYKATRRASHAFLTLGSVSAPIGNW